MSELMPKPREYFNVGDETEKGRIVGSHWERSGGRTYDVVIYRRKDGTEFKEKTESDNFLDINQSAKSAHH